MSLYRKILLVIMGLSIIIAGIGVVFVYPETFGICPPYPEGYACAIKYNEPAGLTAIYGIITLISSIVFIFLPYRFFSAWWKFAIWWIPLSIIAYIFIEDTGGLLSWDKELTLILMNSLYVLISLIIIIVKSFRLRRQGS